MVNCEFSNCVYWDGTLLNCDTSVKPISNWSFSKMVCSGDLEFSTSSVPVYLEKQNETFYLNKTINYGDILLLAFCLLAGFFILVFGVRYFFKNKFK